MEILHKYKYYQITIQSAFGFLEPIVWDQVIFLYL